MSKRARAALVAGIAAAALTFTPVSPAAAAIPMCPQNHSCMFDYYETSEKIKVIGYADQACDGTIVLRGETSSWVNLYSRPC